MNTANTILEFDIILDMLCSHALSKGAKERLRELTPFLSEDACIHKMQETTAARQVLDTIGAPPVATMTDLDEILTAAQAGSMLLPEQLGSVQQFAAACRRMKAYLGKAGAVCPAIGSYTEVLADISQVHEEIERSISADKVMDDASGSLRSIRNKLESTAAQIKDKMARIMTSKKKLLSDSYVTRRNGHFVLAVKKECRNQFQGTVIEISAKGSTVFMEPEAISKLQGQHALLELEEDGEVRRILYTLSALVADWAEPMKQNMNLMETVDVMFAKAKLSHAMDAREPQISSARRVKIVSGRHPLLSSEQCVPLDFEIQPGIQGVIITGPNTGGKTVAVKTVGLLSMMAQSGLHIPCGEGTCLAMHDGYYCDIGDGQSISQNLSTFSGHMTNVIDVLEKITPDSLVLFDELGSGTDPAEGMGIAVAVLEELRRSGCIYLVTTHYPQVKTYAEQTAQVESASMAFDRVSLKPLYRLEMGKTGQSCALYIAKRLGLPEHILKRAHREAYQTEELPEAEIPAPRKKSKLKRHVETQKKENYGGFSLGDSVEVLPEGTIGIVFRPADDKGGVIVQVKGEKMRIGYKRLRLKVAASELYPPDYDFSILFDSVENRKARHKLGKRHNAELQVVYEEIP